MVSATMTLMYSMFSDKSSRKGEKKTRELSLPRVQRMFELFAYFAGGGTGSGTGL